MEGLVRIIIVSAVFTYVFAQYDEYVGSGREETTVDPKYYKKMSAADTRKHILECTEQTKISLNFIVQIKSGYWKKETHDAPGLLKKWALCLLVKSGIMSEGGVLRQDVVLSYVHPNERNKVENVIDECLFKEQHSPVDTAWNYLICFRNKFPIYSIV